jgi:hypothetical protein
LFNPVKSLYGREPLELRVYVQTYQLPRTKCDFEDRVRYPRGQIKGLAIFLGEPDRKGKFIDNALDPV